MESAAAAASPVAPPGAGSAAAPPLRGRVRGLWVRPPRRAVESGAPFRREARHGLAHVRPDGLAGSEEWHRTVELRGEDLEKRALLAQSLAHLAELAEAFPDCPSLRPWSGGAEGARAADGDAGGGAGGEVRGEAQARGEASPGSAVMGENLTLERTLNCDSVCLGDVFEVRRRERGRPPQSPSGAQARAEARLRLQVTQPRRPCSKNDARHARGVRRLAAEQGLAGFFFRPLGDGGGWLAAGDELVLVERPRPGWTLRRVSQAVYGRGLSEHAGYSVTAWLRRTSCSALPADAVQDLRALLECAELPDFEWLDTVRGLLASADSASADLGIVAPVWRAPPPPRKRRFLLPPLLRLALGSGPYAPGVFLPRAAWAVASGVCMFCVLVTAARAIRCRTALSARGGES